MLTFKPYCNLATYLFSEMKVKRARFQTKGIGTIKPAKRAISNTRRRKTYGTPN